MTRSLPQPLRSPLRWATGLGGSATFLPLLAQGDGALLLPLRFNDCPNTPDSVLFPCASWVGIRGRPESWAHEGNGTLKFFFLSGVNRGY